MKNKLLSLVYVGLFCAALSACSSGTTVSPIPVSITGLYTGTFENASGTLNGTATFNLVQGTDGTSVSGNAIFDSEDANCLVNGTITSGTINGFSITLEVSQASAATNTSGSVNVQLTQSNNGNNLDGTYVSNSSNCSSESGSGTISLTRA